MTFFESLLALLGHRNSAAAAFATHDHSLSHPARRCGVALAFIPGAPAIVLDPHTALALFIAPVLLDAAFDFPAGDVRRFWRPLLSLAVIAVVLSAGAVTWLGMALASLPFYAALALGAIVCAARCCGRDGDPQQHTHAAPHRGAAQGRKPSQRQLQRCCSSARRSRSAAMAAGIVRSPLHIIAVAPGGVLLGLAVAWLVRRVQPFVMGTLSGNILEFITGFGAWILAERLGLSAVLCLVTFAMAIAHRAGLTTPLRAWIHDYAVWDTAVFLLSVPAFLLMGFQVRTIVGDMGPERLCEAAWFWPARSWCA